MADKILEDFPDPCLGCEDNDKQVAGDLKGDICRNCNQDEEYECYRAGIEKGRQMERERILKVMDGYCVREIDHAKTMKARLEIDNAQSSYIHSEETIIATLERVRQALKEGK